MDIHACLLKAGKRAKQAAAHLRTLSGRKKDDVLLRIARKLDEERAPLLAANAEDVNMARESGLDEAKINRLTLTDAIIDDMCRACRAIAALPDPIGSFDEQWRQPNGMLVGRMRIPLGVIAMIFEARPNVVIEASALCLKAGNAILLRGGSEAQKSNAFLGAILRRVLEENGLPAGAAQVIESTDRQIVRELCHLDEYVDVMIPRGGKELIRLVTREAAMPVLKHDQGVCHLYVDEYADTEMAVALTCNSKLQRPATCNSLEGLLVHKAVAPAFLPAAAAALTEAGVILHLCPESMKLLANTALPGSCLVPLEPADRGREYLSLALSVIIVDSMEEAMAYIEQFGSNHTEVICTEKYSHAMKFVQQVNASMVGVNVSVRLNDGAQLGLGAEIGISTTKLHSYGPMGLKELTATKFTVLGTGQVRL